MGKNAAAAATAVKPATTATGGTAEAAPTKTDLASIISRKPVAAPAKPVATPDHDPDFDDEAEPAADEAEGEASAPTGDEPAAAAEPESGETETPTEDPLAVPAKTEGEEPAPDEGTEPTDLDAEDAATRKGFTPEQQARFDKAMQKKHGKVKELQTQLEERDRALATLAAAPAVAATPTAADPLADVEDETALNQRLADSRALWKWARLHPQGGTLKDQAGNEVEITPERVLEIQVEEEEMRDVHGPRRAQFLKDRAARESEAVAVYPWLKNMTSQGAVEIEAMLRRNPGLRSVPGIKLILADHLTHRQVRATKKPSTPTGLRPGEIRPLV